MTHIKEVNEQLDYDAFYEHRQDTTSAGRATWQLWQGMADHYPCPPCKRGAQALAYGGQDTVGILLEKKGYPRHPDNFNDLVSMVNQAAAKVGMNCTGGLCRRVEHTHEH